MQINFLHKYIYKHVGFVTFRKQDGVFSLRLSDFARDFSRQDAKTPFPSTAFPSILPYNRLLSLFVKGQNPIFLNRIYITFVRY